MALLATDYISANRAGTPGDGSTGTYYVETVQAILDLIPGGVVVSADAGNTLIAGTDQGALLTTTTLNAAIDARVPTSETTTALSYVSGTQTLTYTDEDGAPTNLDLSGLTTDLRVDGASISAGGLITFTVNDAGTATDFTLDMSTYLSGVTDNQAAGTFTAETGGGNTVIQKTAWMSASVAP